jgi:hypothetical protein
LTSVNQLGTRVIHYALVSGGIISNIEDFKAGVAIISSHMPFLVDLCPWHFPSLWHYSVLRFLTHTQLQTR